jgi:hypothetical protein
MKILVKKVADAYGFSELNYLLKRLAKFQMVNFPSTDEFTREVARLNAAGIPVVAEKNFPRLSAAQIKDIEKAKECAKKVLAKEYPLLPGEKIKKEAFSYLAAPFENEPAGTGLLLQTTNFAEICFLFDDVRIHGEGIRFVKPATVGGPIVVAAPQVGGIVASLALSLATGLLSGIAGEIGTLICKKIFQAADIDYFEPTSEMIKKIVHAEVTTTLINQINGQVNGTKDWISARYAPEKEGWLVDHNPATLRYMQTELNSYADNLLTQVIGPLMQDQFAKPGFVVYLIGAGVLYSIYQELALIDERVKDPGQSTYAKTVSTLAGEYAKFAQTTYTNIINDRKGMIYMKQERVCSYAGGYPVCNDFWRWYDTCTNENQEFSPGKKESLDDARKKCADSMNQHIQAMLVKLNTDLGDPNSIVPLWQKLVAQPIPKAAAK